MNKTKKSSPEVREGAVRLVQEGRKDHPSLWAAIESVAPKIGCTSHTLHDWVKKHEIDTGMRDGVTTAEPEHIKALEREVKELRHACWIASIGSSRRIGQTSCGSPISPTFRPCRGSSMSLSSSTSSPPA